MRLQKADLIDCTELSEITLRSKAYWGYSKEQMKIWKPDLIMTEVYIQNNFVFKLIDGTKAIGFFSFLHPDREEIVLDSLFVDPDFIGSGYGSYLMQKAIRFCQKINVRTIVLEADPNAVKFYLKHSFEIASMKESSVPGRFLPIMHLKV